MKHLMLVLLQVILLAGTCRLQAQSEEEMKAWMAYMTPSDIHKMIARSDGEWVTNLTMWMDPKAKPVTSTGTCVDPITGKDMKVRETLKIIDDTHHVMEMFMTADGTKEFKSMEIRFTKK